MKKVKILLALVALVAMVGVASMANAATGPVSVSATVDPTLALAMDTCGSTGIPISGLGQSDTGSGTCNFNVSVNETYDLYVSDTDDTTTEACSPVGCIKASVEADQIDGNASDPFDPTSTAGKVGYYLSYGGSDTVSTCTGTAAVCAAIQSPSTIPVLDGTEAQSVVAWTLGMSVSTFSDQMADTYSDTWTVNLVSS